jgi:ADP-ribosyl-[dinitrogen reductase] hydrolase
LISKQTNKSTTKTPCPRYDKLKGCFFGLAVGDALGVPLEFEIRDTHPVVTDMIGKGPFNLKPGEWTDDTSMALCLADSLISCKGFNPTDVMNSFVHWWLEGEHSHTGTCFDIGQTTVAALRNYMEFDNPWAGSTSPSSSGNGSIMRLAPIPIFYKYNLYDCITYAQEQSKLTHASFDCVETCGKMAACLWNLASGAKWDDFVYVDQYKNIPRDDVQSSGYVIHTWEAALWAVSNTSSFEEALILAVNLANDSDTVGAVTGQLAGALYGYESIPERWIKNLAWKTELGIIFDELYNSN